MPKSRSGTAAWSSRLLDALRAIPAPLRTPEQGEALNEAVAMLQDAPTRAAQRSVAPAASAELVRIVDATVDARRVRGVDDAVLFALKMLAYVGGRGGLDCIVRAARCGYATDGFMWSVALAPFGEGHPGAPMLFDALSKPLPEKFLGISLLDAANSAAREHGLRRHPFDSPAGVKRLAGFLASRRSRDGSYAVSACAALPFIGPARRKPLVRLARRHKDPAIRMEVAWATARMGDPAGLDYLVTQCSDRNHSVQAQQYLTELGRSKLVPKSAREPDFVALAVMCQWLGHPNEYGEPPDRIELMDKRTIYWPPTRDTREVRLFRFVYEKRRDNPRRVGVGMVGSVTWAFFDETKPSMKPEDIYGLHCCWELEVNEDPRAPKRRSAKAGWALVKADGVSDRARTPHRPPARG